MSTSPEQLKSQIMRRVYMVHLLKRVTSPVAIRVYIVVAVLWQVVLRVSVINVIKNSPNVIDLGHFSQFAIRTFQGTELIVQVLVAALFAFGVWLVRDILKMRHVNQLQTA